MIFTPIKMKKGFIGNTKEVPKSIQEEPHKEGPHPYERSALLRLWSKPEAFSGEPVKTPTSRVPSDGHQRIESGEKCWNDSQSSKGRVVDRFCDTHNRGKIYI